MRIEIIRKMLADYDKNKTLLELFKSDHPIISYLKNFLNSPFLDQSDQLELRVFLNHWQNSNNFVHLKTLDTDTIGTDLFENWRSNESLERIPNEVIVDLFPLLSKKESFSLALTCKRFCALWQETEENMFIEPIYSIKKTKPFSKIFIDKTNKFIVSLQENFLEFRQPADLEMTENFQYPTPITAKPIFIENKIVSKFPKIILNSNTINHPTDQNSEIKYYYGPARVLTGHASGDVYFNTRYDAPRPIITGLAPITSLIMLDKNHIATADSIGNVYVYKFNVQLTALDLEYEEQHFEKCKANDTPRLWEKSLFGKNKQHQEKIFELLNNQNEKILYSCSADAICKWDLISGSKKIRKCLPQTGNFTSAFLCNKKVLIIGTDKGYILKYDFQNEPIILARHSNAIHKIATYKNNIITRCSDGLVQVWINLFTHAKRTQVFQSEFGKIIDFNIADAEMVAITDNNSILKCELKEKPLRQVKQTAENSDKDTEPSVVVIEPFPFTFSTNSTL